LFSIANRFRTLYFCDVIKNTHKNYEETYIAYRRGDDGQQRLGAGAGGGY